MERFILVIVAMTAKRNDTCNSSSCSGRGGVVAFIAVVVVVVLWLKVVGMDKTFFVHVVIDGGNGGGISDGHMEKVNDNDPMIILETITS